MLEMGDAIYLLIIFINKHELDCGRGERLLKQLSSSIFFLDDCQSFKRCVAIKAIVRLYSELSTKQAEKLKSRKMKEG